MKLNVIVKTSTSLTIELENNDIVTSSVAYDVYLNGEKILEANRQNVFSVYNLKPYTEYYIKLMDATGEMATKFIQTDIESICLNVRKFNAIGDGVTDDTQAIQAAIMSCPKHGRVFIPAGNYKVRTIFLKSDMTLEFAKGATLSYAGSFYEGGAILPGYLVDHFGEAYYLGSWEGNPLDSYTALIQGINIENVNIIGKGVLDGNGHRFWDFPKVKKGALRPRLVQLIHSKFVSIQGLTICNSPSWTIHPLFSDALVFADLKIINPKDSPNTDGLNPESCNRVLIVGVYFSVGGDCIAIKAGKIYLGRKLKRSTRYVTIRNCTMNFGHGAVAIGSEMACGVKNITVSRCIFNETDRGLHIKTCRGRGKDAIIDQICFNNIKMNRVLTPLVINSFYFGDADDQSEYVKTKEKLPVDDRTPYIGTLVFEDIECENSSIAAGFFYGLPEKPIEALVLKKCHFTFTEDASPGYPAMMDDIKTYCRAGLIFNHVKCVTMDHVKIKGVLGEKVILNDVGKVVMGHDD